MMKACTHHKVKGRRDNMQKLFQFGKTSKVSNGLTTSPRIYERTETLHPLILNAVDETLKTVFNEGGAQVIYRYLSLECQLTKEEIPKRPEIFSDSLKRLLGSAAPVIERLIVRNLCGKLDLNFEEREDHRIVSYIDDLRR